MPFLTKFFSMLLYNNKQTKNYNHHAPTKNSSSAWR